MKPTAGKTSTLLLALLTGCGIEQGVEFQTNVESFTQAEDNKVDILWVVDDSHSMMEEQATLIGGFQSFAGQLEASGTDFQLGVISTSFEYTDPNAGVLKGDPPYLTNADDYMNAFAERAVVGTGGSDKEKGLEAALFALSAPMVAPGSPNEGFVRADAQLLVVFVSDEEDCSDGGTLEGEPSTACYTELDRLIPVETIASDLQELKSDPDKVSVGAIVGTRASTCPEVYEGTRYLSVAALLGGLIGDICQADWSRVLGDLGLNATGIRTRFQLMDAAQPDTIEVTVDETPVLEDPVNGWTYDPATWWLEFHGAGVPPRGAVIGVRYTVDPGMVAPETTAATP